jgi:hypothetical protein
MRAFVLLALVAVVGCIPTGYAPPTVVPVERPPQPVAASFDRTWNAAVELFARENIPIEAPDRASGVLTSRDVIYTTGAKDTVAAYADCGIDYPNTPEWRAPRLPRRARFTAVIKGDSSRSSILVRAFFFRFDEHSATHDDIACPTRGTFESRTEKAIASRVVARQRN